MYLEIVNTCKCQLSLSLFKKLAVIVGVMALLGHSIFKNMVVISNKRHN